MKGLESIEQYKQIVCPHCQYHNKENCNVKCFINIIEKELKALKIIKEKELNIVFVKRYNLEDFNYQCRYDQQLSKEEYKLLKEVLK